MLVMLLAAIDKVEAYELLLGPEAVDDMEPEVEWNRGPGEGQKFAAVVANRISRWSVSFWGPIAGRVNTS